MSAYIALLRAINVGGNNSLPMKDLAAMFVAAGCKDVQTYIQSGNVVFSASPKLVGRLAKTIEKAIEKKSRLRVPVVMRSAGALDAAIKANPFVRESEPTERLYIAFLADVPTPAQIASLDANRSPPDEFQVIGGEIHLRFANGAGKTKLTNAYFDSKLKTISTMRNWNTVQKLRELASNLE